MMPPLTENQEDALKELINIGVGRAAGMLNEMTSSRIRLRVPWLRVAEAGELKSIIEGDGEQLSAVKMGFGGPLSGTAALIFPKTEAALLVSHLTGEPLDTPDIDALRAVTLTEIGNIVVNCVLGSMMNLIQRQITFTLPNYCEGDLSTVICSSLGSSTGRVLLVRTRFCLEEMHLEGDIVLILEVGSLDQLITGIESLEI